MTKKDWRRDLAERKIGDSEAERLFIDLFARSSTELFTENASTYPNRTIRTNAWYRIVLLSAVDSFEKYPDDDPLTNWVTCAEERGLVINALFTTEKNGGLAASNIENIGRLAIASVDPAGSYTYAELLVGLNEGHLKIDSDWLFEIKQTS